jgi:hypothetical protein
MGDCNGGVRPGDLMRLVALAFAFALMLPFAFAAQAYDLVVVNSPDWHDVISGASFAYVSGVPVKFAGYPGDLVSFSAKIGVSRSILLIESAQANHSLASMLPAMNVTPGIYNVSGPLASNLELARMSNASGFIIIGPNASDYALSALGYAAQKKYFIVFADASNAEDVHVLLLGKSALVLGPVDDAVSRALLPLNLEHVGGADKFADNIAMASRTLALGKGSKILISDGSFIESSMLAGGVPIVLSGGIVSDSAYTFVKSNVMGGGITGILLVGNGLVAPVYDMRERIRKDAQAESGTPINLSVQVKLADVVAGNGSGVMTLERISLPKTRLGVDITGAYYDPQSRTISITLENNGDAGAFFSYSGLVKMDGNAFMQINESGAAFIGRDERATVSYPADFSSIRNGAFNASFTVKFGPSGESFEDFSYAEFGIFSINYTDTTEATVASASYDKEAKAMRITIRNPGTSPVNVIPVLEVPFGGVRINITGAALREIAPASMYAAEFPLEWSDSEASQSANLTVYLTYGADWDKLDKHAVYHIAYVRQAGGYDLTLVMVGLLLFIGAGIYYLRLRHR